MFTHSNWGHVSEKKLSIWDKFWRLLEQKQAKVTENWK